LSSNTNRNAEEHGAADRGAKDRRHADGQMAADADIAEDNIRRRDEAGEDAAGMTRRQYAPVRGRHKGA